MSDTLAAPPSLDSVVAAGSAMGASPEDQALAIHAWRNDVHDYGRQTVAAEAPDAFFSGNDAVDKDVSGALATLRQQSSTPDHPAFQPPPKASNQFSPISGPDGGDLGVYQIRPGADGHADVSVHLHHPDGGRMEQGLLSVPVVSEEDVAKERSKADEAARLAQSRYESVFASPGDTEFGGSASSAQRDIARDAKLRAEQLKGPDARGILQHEKVLEAFKKSPLAGKAGQWGLAQDVQRGLADLSLGVTGAFTSTVGTRKANDEVRKAQEMLPQVLPGTTRPTKGAELSRGLAEMGGQLPVYAVPGAGPVLLAASTYGGSVNHALNAADAADAQAAVLAGKNPELASEFTGLAHDLRRDARTGAALSAANVLLMGKLIPKAQSFLGKVGRGAAEMAAMTAVKEQVIDPATTGERGDPLNILKAALIGAAAAVPGALVKPKAGSADAHVGSSPAPDAATSPAVEPTSESALPANSASASNRGSPEPATVPQGGEGSIPSTGAPSTGQVLHELFPELSDPTSSGPAAPSEPPQPAAAGSSPTAAPTEAAATPSRGDVVSGGSGIEPSKLGKLRSEAIKEAKTEDGSKTSTQLTFSPEQAKPFVDFAKSIPDEKLYSAVDPEWADDARETEPHVTALYGLHDPDSAAAARVVAQHGPITVKMGKTSLFSNDKYDVLKVDVHGPQLHALNADLSKLPNSNSYPEYKPHATIAYLKKGEGKAYEGDTRFEGKELTFDSVTHSPPSKLREAFGRPELPLSAPPESELAPWADRTILNAQGRVSMGLDPELLAAYAVKGAGYLAQGVKSFTAWSAAMVKQFGEGIKKHLGAIWHATQAYVKGALAHARKTSETGAANLSPLNQAKQQLRESGATLRSKWNARDAKKMIAAREDVADTRPALVARQAGNHIRRTFGYAPAQGFELFKKIVTGKETPANEAAIADMEAAPFVVEAHQKIIQTKLDHNAANPTAPVPVTASTPEAKGALAAQLSDLMKSPDPKAKAYVPVLQRALSQFDDLMAKSRAAMQLMAGQRSVEQRQGIESGEVEYYITHVYGNLDDIRGRTAPQELFGGTDPGSTSSKYFTKGRTFTTLVDAIQAGYEPQSTNIADLAQHRIKSGQKLVERARNRAALFSTPDPTTGQPIAVPIAPGAKAPADYTPIDAAGTTIGVLHPYKGLFEALYGSSAVRNSTAGRAVIRTAMGIKHGTVVVDMVHLARILFRQLVTTGSIGQRRALALVEHSLTDIAAMEQSGEITPQEANWVRSQKIKYNKLLGSGLLIGRHADALWADSVGVLRHAIEKYTRYSGIPSLLRATEQFTEFTFMKATRAGMVETALQFVDRNLKHGLPVDQAYRLAALETNRMYGNLGRQGVLKSRTFQDIARMTLFAPQWFEGTLTSELQGSAQMLKAPFSSAVNRRLIMGNVARAMLGGTLGMLAANQLINYASTGHSTFGNEEGHGLDAWLPGGNYGFWISPFTFLNPVTESLHRYYHREQPRTLDDAANAATKSVLQVLENKLSGPARGVLTFAKGTDYAGRPFQNFSGRFTEGLLSASPLPIPLQSVLQRNPGEWPRLTLQGSSPGAFEKQAAASLGIHLIAAQGPTDKMYALAKKFRPDASGAVHQASKYTVLRQQLRHGDADNAAAEMLRLVQSGDAKIANMDEAMGLAGGYHRPSFTGTKQGEQDLLKSLKPEDKGTYQAALVEHQQMFRSYLAQRKAIFRQLLAAQHAAGDLKKEIRLAKIAE